MNTETRKKDQSAMLMDQFGRRLAARLDVSSNQISHDISERLRVARLQALSARKSNVWETKTASAIQMQGNSASLNFDFVHGNIWNKFASLLPLIALLVGVFILFNFHDNKITSELAEVDSKLLLDDLPPIAYTDPGFLKFLQNTSANALVSLKNGTSMDNESNTDSADSDHASGSSN
jgi:hypothetical protein